jgi:uncharacterized protein YfaT (DUF1175 family)
MREYYYDLPQAQLLSRAHRFRRRAAGKSLKKQALAAGWVRRVCSGICRYGGVDFVQGRKAKLVRGRPPSSKRNDSDLDFSAFAEQPEHKNEDQYRRNDPAAKLIGRCTGQATS